MKDVIKYGGLDVHKETVAVPVAEGNGGEVCLTHEKLRKSLFEIDFF